MFDFIDKIFEAAKQKPLTIRNRVAFIKSIAAEVTPPPTNLSFLRREKLVLARVTDSSNILTQYNRLCHVVKAIELEKDSVSKKTMNRYTAMLRKLKPHKLNIENDNRLTDEQKQRYLTLGQVKTFLEYELGKLFDEYSFPRRTITEADIDRLKSVTNRKKLNIYTFAKNFQQLCIMACYVYQPAIRNNYGLMKVSTSKKEALKDTEYNYYYINNRSSKTYIIMNNYKNVAHMGKGFELEVNDKLKIVIKNWLFLLKAINPAYKYIFYYSIESDGTIKHSNNQSTIGRTIPRIFEKYTKRALSINDMRHIWEIAIQKSDVYKNSTVGQREKIHAQLLHGHLTGIKYNLLYHEESKDRTVNL